MFEKMVYRKYDVLEHRNPEFDVDYEEFIENVKATENDMRFHLDSLLSVTQDINQALWLLAR